jgi:hypothetical protein
MTPQGRPSCLAQSPTSLDGGNQPRQIRLHCNETVTNKWWRGRSATFKFEGWVSQPTQVATGEAKEVSAVGMRRTGRGVRGQAR